MQCRKVQATRHIGKQHMTKDMYMILQVIQGQGSVMNLQVCSLQWGSSKAGSHLCATRISQSITATGCVSVRQSKGEAAQATTFAEVPH